MSYRVRIAADEDGARWEEFRAASGKLNQAAVHHAFDWRWRRILSRSFGHEPLYLIAEDAEGRTVGALPLFYVRSFLFGSALISVPYLNAGGLAAQSADVAALLEQTVNLHARERNVDYVELRCRGAEQALQEKYASRTHKVAMELQLAEDAEELFKSFPAKLRSQIRRPTKSGLYTRNVTGSEDYADDLRAFYSVFAENMRDLGTPVYPRRLFEETLRQFDKRARVITVWQEQRPLAAAITVRDGTGVEIPWASSLKKANKLSPNMLLYWEAIKSACHDGAASFDFGRSSEDSGTYRFKKQWGAERVPLHWYYDRSLKVPDINPNSGRFGRAVACWRRLPVPLANALGPWLTRAIP